MLRSFLEQAKADLPVYITDVRNAFDEKGDRPFSIHLQLYNSAVRVFPLRLPRTRDEEEDVFVADYIYAMIYNLISSLGGLQMDLYLDTEDEKACALAASLDRVFGTDAKKLLRSGYGRCLNVNERILRTLTGKEAKFTFHIHDQREEPVVCDFAASWGTRMDFAAVPDMVKDKMLLGIDVGGTDIKLAASIRGDLVLCKDFDWSPAGFTGAGQMIDPIMQLIRLMRDACSLVSVGKTGFCGPIRPSPSLWQRMRLLRRWTGPFG